MFSIEEIRFLLELIAEKHGPGYAEDETVAKIQGKLSMMLEYKGGTMESSK